MMFDDDEQIVSIEDTYFAAAEYEDSYTIGKAKFKMINSSRAPLDQTNLRVLIELTGVGDPPGLDLVAVLDVGRSMKGEKLEKLKKAMIFVIKKLGPIHRLSVVTFSDNATRLCPLRVVTETSQIDIIDLVKGINAGGSSNITEGLEQALRILKERRFADGRNVGVMLTSAGEQNKGGDAAQVQIGNIPVYTFRFGKGSSDPKAKADVLREIAKDQGGTFTDVENINDLRIAFAQCLTALLTVSVQDLKLSLSSPKGKKMPGMEPEKISKIENVSAGDYDQSMGNDSAVSVAFGNLYNKETRKIIVDLILHKVPKEVNQRVLQISYNFISEQGLEKKSKPVFASVKRAGKFTKEEEEEEVIVEGSHLETAHMMKEARVLADSDTLNGAKNKLLETQNMLKDVKIFDGPDNSIEKLKAELQQLMIYMQSPDLDKSSGLPFASSSELSHEPQHTAAGGDLEKLRLFSTPSMVAYAEQAKSFDKDPTKLPVPTAKEDVKEGVLAAPLISLAGALRLHIQASIQALQAVESIMNVLLHDDQ